MASYGGVDLGTGGAGVFELTSESDDEEFVYPLPAGSVAVIPASSRYIVVRQCPGRDFDEVHKNAREAANRGIDIHFGQGGRPLVMGHKNSTYMVGWISSAGHTLRIVGRNQRTTRFSAKAEVRDADGHLVVQPAPPPKVWHESLRYYRISESSTDLYDSFRNLYLAIESLLSDVVPPTAKPSGNPEGDSAWLKRALRVAGQTIDLSLYTPLSPKAPHNAIHQDLYASLRTAIFHAKTGRATWPPQLWSSRSMMVAARLRYARMFRALAAEYLDISYPSGGFAKAFWESTWDALLRDQLREGQQASTCLQAPRLAHAGSRRAGQRDRRYRRSLCRPGRIASAISWLHIAELPMMKHGGPWLRRERMAPCQKLTRTNRSDG